MMDHVEGPKCGSCGREDYNRGTWIVKCDKCKVVIPKGAEFYQFGPDSHYREVTIELCISCASTATVAEVGRRRTQVF